MNGIVSVFCQSKREPLLIGSTKSNMGHPEPASGLAALAKVSLQACPSITYFFCLFVFFVIHVGCIYKLSRLYSHVKKWKVHPIESVCFLFRPI